MTKKYFFGPVVLLPTYKHMEFHLKQNPKQNFGFFTAPEYSPDFNICIFSAKTQEYMSEISQLESLVWTSQSLLQKQVKMFTEQMEKVAIANRDNEKLIMDTQELFKEINVMKKINQAHN